MELKIKRLHPDATLPIYATEGAACFDLHAVAVRGLSNAEESVLRKHGYEDRCDIRVPPGSSEVFNTGLAFEVPPGWAMMIYSRSGHGFQNATRLANCVGVIDSDYRGEVKVKLTCDATEFAGRGITVRSGDRIAQAMLVPIERITFVEADDELSWTTRAAAGFGSTGA